MAKRQSRIGVLGASGYVGAELMRLVLGHPHMELALVVAHRAAGQPIEHSLPNFTSVMKGRLFEAIDLEDDDISSESLSSLAQLDLLFLALPHEASARVMTTLSGHVQHIVDLSAAFRLKDPAAYATWYGFDHPAPNLLSEAVYGMPELSRTGLKDAPLVAAAGCYVTAATLALAPLLSKNIVQNRGIIVDAASGVSGAGRELNSATQFCAVDENLSAYSLFTHRHTPEMEQALGCQLLFTPHLAPMNRGILATCYAQASAGIEQSDIDTAMKTAYDSEPFVHVIKTPPSTKATAGSNSVHLQARLDPRTGWVVTIAALDNLVKGAAGQAIQCANVVLGYMETDGLSQIGFYP